MKLDSIQTFLFDTLPEIHRTYDLKTKQKSITRPIIKSTNGTGIVETETRDRGQLWRFLYCLSTPIDILHNLFKELGYTYDLKRTKDLNFWLDVWWFFHTELLDGFTIEQSGVEFNYPPAWNDRKKRLVLKDLLLAQEYLGSLSSLDWYIRTILDYSRKKIKLINYWDFVFYLNVEKCVTLNLCEKYCVGDINTFTNPEQHLIKSSTCTPIPYGEGGYGEFNYGGNCNNGEWEIQHVVANGGGDEGYFTDILVDGDNVYIVSIINDTNDNIRLSISNDGGDTWSYYFYGAWATYFDTGVNGVWLGKRLSIEKKDNILWIMWTNFSGTSSYIAISGFDLDDNTWDDWDGLILPHSSLWSGFWHDYKIFDGKMYVAYIGIENATSHGLHFSRSETLPDNNSDPISGWEVYDNDLTNSLGWDNWGIAIDVIANTTSNSVFIIGPGNEYNPIDDETQTCAVVLYSSDNGDSFNKTILDYTSVYVSGSVAAKDEDNVVISYYDSANSRLRFGKSTDGGANFVMSTITTGITDYVAMRVKDDNIRVVFYDGSAGDLKLAESNDLGVSWNILTIDSVDDVGTHTSIQYVNDIIYISYRDESNGSLKFSKYVVAENGGVELLQLDHNFLVNFPPSLFITDSSDNLIPEEDYIVDWDVGTIQFNNLSYIGETFNFYYCYNKFIYDEANEDPDDEIVRHKTKKGYLTEDVSGLEFTSSRGYVFNKDDIALLETDLVRERGEVEKYLGDYSNSLYDGLINSFVIDDKIYKLSPIHYSVGNTIRENHWKLKIYSDNDIYYEKKLAVLNKDTSKGGIKDWCSILIDDYFIEKIN